MSIVRKSPTTGLAYTRELGTGTADATTFLRGDNTWAAAASGQGAGAFVLSLGYGPDQFSGTLPGFLEGSPHFWLLPFTSINNVSALVVGASHNDMPIEWEAGRTYQHAELDVYVRTIGLSSGGGGGPSLLVAISKNGADTAVSVTLPASETNARHKATGALSIADGDRVGVHVTADDMSSGSLVASVVARLY